MRGTRTVSYAKLDTVQRKLLDAAENAIKMAYDPYSNFHVGAAILTKDGKIISGSNFGNAASPSSMCAERSAIFSANAMGYHLFEAMAVIAKGKSFDTTEPTSPCGGCRQVIYEASQLSGNDIQLILSTTKKGKIIISSINELLPLAFGPKNLKVKLKDYKK